MESPDALLARVAALCDAKLPSIEARYILGQELGQGRFSIVRLATCRRTGRQFAAKVVENSMFDDEESVEAFETEVRILRTLEHPLVVKLEEVLMCAEETYLLIELLTGGELFTQIAEEGALDEPGAKRLFAQVVIITVYLHGLGIAHRDIKPENLMFADEGRRCLKLIDFGYAGTIRAAATGAAAGGAGAGAGAGGAAGGAGAAGTPATAATARPTPAPGSEGLLTGLCGTPDYVAPEVLSWYEEGSEGQPYGLSSDVWSLGTCCLRPGW
jgi:serine/threonine protein kinase